MIFKGIVTAVTAVALAATPALAAEASARAATTQLAPATESVEGSQLDGGANIIVIVLALVAAGLGLWAIVDDGGDEPVSP